MSVIILGIESSCDDTSAAIIKDGVLLSNVIANQEVHEKYGGVVPELASRAHQQNIVPVVSQAVKEAGIKVKDINGVAFTKGPGLLGSLLVGVSFAKGMALAGCMKLIDVNHLLAHVLVHFISENKKVTKHPEFPFLCLLVSGGHTQIIVVKDHLEMEVIGRTIDDAAGEAFDKCGKVMGLPYPGGPHIDKLAKIGNPEAFKFNKPVIPGYDFSFSGLKTSFLYFLRDQLKENKHFIDENINDLSASIQKTIVDILLKRLREAVKATNIKQVAIAGGVSANSHLRNCLIQTGKDNGWDVFLPEIKYTTDNAAMIGITGYYKYLKGDFSEQSIVPLPRHQI